MFKDELLANSANANVDRIQSRSTLYTHWTPVRIQMDGGAQGAVLEVIQSLVQQGRNEAHVQRIKRGIWQDPNCSVRAIWNTLALQTERFHVITADSFGSFFRRHSVHYPPDVIRLLIRRYGIQSGTHSEHIQYSSFLEAMKPISQGACDRSEKLQTNIPIAWLLLLSAIEIKYELEWRSFLSRLSYKFGRNTEQLFQLLCRDNGKELFKENLQTLFRQHGYSLEEPQLSCLFRFFGTSSNVISLNDWKQRMGFETPGVDFQPSTDDRETRDSMETIERFWTKYMAAKTDPDTDQQQIKHNLMSLPFIDNSDAPLCEISPIFDRTTDPLSDQCHRSTSPHPFEYSVSTGVSRPSINFESLPLSNSAVPACENDSSNVPDSDRMHDPGISCIENHFTNRVTTKLLSSLACNYCSEYPPADNPSIGLSKPMANKMLSEEYYPESIDVGSGCETNNDNISSEQSSVTTMELQHHSKDFYSERYLENDDAVSIDSTFELNEPSVSTSDALLVFLQSQTEIAQRIFELKRKLSEKPGFSIDAVESTLQTCTGNPDVPCIMALFQRNSIHAEAEHFDLLIAAVFDGNSDFSRSALEKFFNFNGLEIRRLGILKEYHVALFFRNLFRYVVASERSKTLLLAQNVSFMALFEMLQVNGKITTESLNRFSPQIDGMHLLSRYGSSGQMRFSQFCSMVTPHRLVPKKAKSPRTVRPASSRLTPST